MDVSIPPETVHSIFSSRERRIVLAELHDGHVHHIDDLAATTVEVLHDGDTSPSPDGEPSRESVSIALVHNHLPRLADHGIVEWDQRSGDVVKGEHFDEILPYLESLYPDEQESSLAVSTDGCSFADQ